MEILHVSDKETGNFDKLVLDSSIANTESDIFLFDYNGRRYVLKELYPFCRNKYDNRIRTLLSIDSNRDIIPDYFIKPEYFVSSDYQIRYWASKFINGINLSSILSDDHVSFEIKKRYLKRIGYYLKQMDYIRRNTLLNDFYIDSLTDEKIIRARKKMCK